MSIRTARLRALHICAVAALCLLGWAVPANADDGTPPARPVPLARSLPRTFASYDALLATASAVAGDQALLAARLQRARVEDDLARSILATVADPRVRG